MLWLFFFLCFLFNYASTILSKQFGVTNHWWYVAMSMLSAALSSLTWSYMMKKGWELSSVTPLMSVSLIISVVLSGFLFYGEAMNAQKIIGVALGIVAILLIINA